MRKKISILIALLICLAMAVPAFATGSETQETPHPLRLVDDADLLTPDEEESVMENLDYVSEEHNFDVVIVTVDSLGEKTPQGFADDYFDYNGYGMGPDDDGIILVISMEYRDWAISTHAFGITAFTDAGQEYLMGNVTPFLSDGNYESAFDTFAWTCEDFIKQAKTGEPYDVGNMPSGISGYLMVVLLIPSLILAMIVSIFLKKMKRKSLKAVRFRADATEYLTAKKITHKSDTFLYRDVVTVKVETDDGPGGSTTHTSSSGRVHGGSSGKF